MERKLLQNLWNPFRDWNKSKHKIMTELQGYKTSETLLGIETKTSTGTPANDKLATKPLKPF